MADKRLDEACPICGGLNGIHVAACSEAPVAEERKEDRRLSDATRMALAVGRLQDALAATPINIALGALATVVGRAQASFQKEPNKRRRNIEIFMQTVGRAMELEDAAEHDRQAKAKAAQMSDPLRIANAPGKLH